MKMLNFLSLKSGFLCLTLLVGCGGDNENNSVDTATSIQTLEEAETLVTNANTVNRTVTVNRLSTDTSQSVFMLDTNASSTPVVRLDEVLVVLENEQEYIEFQLLSDTEAVVIFYDYHEAASGTLTVEQFIDGEFEAIGEMILLPKEPNQQALPYAFFTIPDNFEANSDRLRLVLRTGDSPLDIDYLVQISNMSSPLLLEVDIRSYGRIYPGDADSSALVSGDNIELSHAQEDEIIDFESFVTGLFETEDHIDIAVDSLWAGARELVMSYATDDDDADIVEFAVFVDNVEQQNSLLIDLDANHARASLDQKLLEGQQVSLVLNGSTRALNLHYIEALGYSKLDRIELGDPDSARLQMNSLVQLSPAGQTEPLDGQITSGFAFNILANNDGVSFIAPRDITQQLELSYVLGVGGIPEGELHIFVGPTQSQESSEAQLVGEFPVEQNSFDGTWINPTGTPTSTLLLEQPINQGDRIYIEFGTAGANLLNVDLL